LGKLLDIRVEPRPYKSGYIPASHREGQKKNKPEKSSAKERVGHRSRSSPGKKRRGSACCPHGKTEHSSATLVKPYTRITPAKKSPEKETDARRAASPYVRQGKSSKRGVGKGMINRILPIIFQRRMRSGVPENTSTGAKDGIQGFIKGGDSRIVKEREKGSDSGRQYIEVAVAV